MVNHKGADSRKIILPDTQQNILLVNIHFGATYAEAMAALEEACVEITAGKWQQ